MASATVFWIPSAIEPVFWGAIFIVCAYLIARRCARKFFLHGFMVSIFNSVWITGAHALFYTSYIQSHPDVARMYASGFAAGSPRTFMIMFGPVFGAVFGVVLGLSALVASKIVKKPVPATG